ncbi:transglutaminase family protein [Hydrogenophaga sp. 5NK40-0174]|uniref:transglutaminase family protein n=1 Tax=Hydrogenophaga sp. 5NK40-0174 TaxID=3127649 RepID=UPI00310B2511
MRLRVEHSTYYAYSEPLLYMVQNLHMWPMSGAAQTVERWHVNVPSPLHEQPDGVGNHVHSFSLAANVEQDLRHIAVIAKGVVQTHGVSRLIDPPQVPHPAFYLRSTPHAEPHPRMAAWAREMVPALAAALDARQAPSVADLVVLTEAVADKVKYNKGRTQVDTTALEAFDWGLGVCQDQAHVMVAVCRSLGLPARYVSGYFYAENEPDLASHAWADVCLDMNHREWLSLDVTHRCPTDERHIRLATASDYTVCPPTKGVRQGGGEETMEVVVRISVCTPENDSSLVPLSG